MLVPRPCRGLVRTLLLGSLALAASDPALARSGGGLIPVEEARFVGHAIDVAVSGDTVALTSGEVYVRTGTGWALEADVSANLSVVSLLDDHLVLRGSSLIYLFERSAGTWSAPTLVDADCFGHTAHWTDVWMGRDAQGELLAVASGTDLDVVSCIGSIAEQGAAWAFRHDGAGWDHNATCGGAGTFSFVKTTCSPTIAFGRSVAGWGDTVLVAEALGSTVHVFQESGGGWPHTARLNPDPNGPTGDFAGTPQSLDMFGETVVAGAPASPGGAAWVFDRRPSGSWQRELLASFGPGDSRFGHAVAIDGDRIALGVPGEPGQTNGEVHLFERDQGVWSPAGTLSAPADAGPVLRFGLSVALDGSKLVVGSGSDLAFVYELVPFVAPAAYCTAGTTANGCVASIGAAGTPSASAGAGFDVTASGVEGQKFGLVFYGLSGRTAAPWGMGSSFLCVKSPTQRTTPQSSGGTSGACDGQLSFDWNAWIAAHPTGLGQPFAGGETVQAQGWFRDPPSAKSTSLSNALEFVVCP